MMIFASMERWKRTSYFLKYIFPFIFEVDGSSSSYQRVSQEDLEDKLQGQPWPYDPTCMRPILAALEMCKRAKPSKLLKQLLAEKSQYNITSCLYSYSVWKSRSHFKSMGDRLGRPPARGGLSQHSRRPKRRELLPLSSRKGHTLI